MKPTDLIRSEWETGRNGLDAVCYYYHPSAPPPRNDPIIRCAVNSYPTQRVWCYEVYERRMANGMIDWAGNYGNLNDALRAWRQLTNE